VSIGDVVVKGAIVRSIGFEARGLVSYSHSFASCLTLCTAAVRFHSSHHMGLRRRSYRLSINDRKSTVGEDSSNKGDSKEIAGEAPDNVSDYSDGDGGSGSLVNSDSVLHVLPVTAKVPPAAGNVLEVYVPK
jgi:hypothetical protein